MPAPLLRRPGMTFLGVTLPIIGSVAVALAFTFALASPPLKDQALAWVTARIDLQSVTPASLPQIPPVTVTAQAAPPMMETEREFEAPSSQASRPSESSPDESKADAAAVPLTPDPGGAPKAIEADTVALVPSSELASLTNRSKIADDKGRTALLPSSDLESPTNGSRTADDKSGAVLLRTAHVGEAPQVREPDINGDYPTALLRQAEHGNRQAQYNLAVMYASGRGVPQDEAEAHRWYRRAAEQGDAAAQSIIGSAYLFGRGAPKDYVQAHLWLSLAARGGDNASGKVRDGLERFMTVTQISEARRLTREWKSK